MAVFRANSSVFQGIEEKIVSPILLIIFSFHALPSSLISPPRRVILDVEAEPIVAALITPLSLLECNRVDLLISVSLFLSSSLSLLVPISSVIDRLTISVLRRQIRWWNWCLHKRRRKGRLMTYCRRKIVLRRVSPWLPLQYFSIHRFDDILAALSPSLFLTQLIKIIL